MSNRCDDFPSSARCRFSNMSQSSSKILNQVFYSGEGKGLQQHGGRIFHVAAEVLEPARADGSVDCSVIGTNGHRDESAFLKSERGLK